MTYQSVWWHPNYVEYGTGLNAPKTWPNVQEQYRRPDPLYDLRYYDLPMDDNKAKLYYSMPRLGKPAYRGTFRDKPFTHAAHYPGEDPHGKPVGFFGRVYYENGPPTFKYDGPPKDELYWLERPPYLPSIPKSRASSTPQGGDAESMRGLNTAMSRASLGSRASSSSRPVGGTAMAPTPPRSPLKPSSTSYTRTVQPPAEIVQSVYKSSYSNPSKKMTQDGVGFL